MKNTTSGQLFYELRPTNTLVSATTFISDLVLFWWGGGYIIFAVVSVKLWWLLYYLFHWIQLLLSYPSTQILCYTIYFIPSSYCYYTQLQSTLNFLASILPISDVGHLYCQANPIRLKVTNPISSLLTTPSPSYSNRMIAPGKTLS